MKGYERIGEDCLRICTLFCPSVRLSSYYVHLSICPLICRLFCPSARLFVCLSIRLSVSWPVHSLVLPSIEFQSACPSVSQSFNLYAYSPVNISVSPLVFSICLSSCPFYFFPHATCSFVGVSCPLSALIC